MCILSTKVNRALDVSCKTCTLAKREARKRDNFSPRIRDPYPSRKLSLPARLHSTAMLLQTFPSFSLTGPPLNFISFLDHTPASVGGCCNAALLASHRFHQRRFSTRGKIMIDRLRHCTVCLQKCRTHFFND